MQGDFEGVAALAIGLRFGLVVGGASRGERGERGEPGSDGMDAKL